MVLLLILTLLSWKLSRLLLILTLLSARMLTLLLILTLLSGMVWSEVTKPYGVRMCGALCYRRAMCDGVLYSLNHVACHLSLDSNPGLSDERVMKISIDELMTDQVYATNISVPACSAHVRWFITKGGRLQCEEPVQMSEKRQTRSIRQGCPASFQWFEVDMFCIKSKDRTVKYTKALRLCAQEGNDLQLVVPDTKRKLQILIDTMLPDPDGLECTWVGGEVSDDGVFETWDNGSVVMKASSMENVDYHLEGHQANCPTLAQQVQGVFLLFEMKCRYICNVYCELKIV